jgi:chromosome segregation ATPase
MILLIAWGEVNFSTILTVGGSILVAVIGLYSTVYTRLKTNQEKMFKAQAELNERQKELAEQQKLLTEAQIDGANIETEERRFNLVERLQKYLQEAEVERAEKRALQSAMDALKGDFTALQFRVNKLEQQLITAKDDKRQLAGANRVLAEQLAEAKRQIESLEQREIDIQQKYELTIKQKDDLHAVTLTELEKLRKRVVALERLTDCPSPEAYTEN